MIRFFTYLFAGLVLGGIIHICVILIMPAMSTHNAWTVISSVTEANELHVLGPQNGKLEEALDLDPAFSHAICQIDLNKGPVEIVGVLPSTFWTAALVAQDGSVPYSTTSRTNNSRDMNIGIFNAEQARRLISDELEIDERQQIVRVPTNQMTAIIRVLPTHSSLSAAVENQLKKVRCAPLWS